MLIANAALPSLLRFAVSELLAARGVPATVGAARLDLWNLELAFADLRLGEPGGLQISFGEARVGLVREALLQGRIAIEKVRLRYASFHAGALDGVPAPRDFALALPFEEAHLADLRLVGPSEKLGRDVVVRHARVHRDPGLGEGALGYEVDVDAGGAPLTLRGTLHEDDEALRIEGRLSTSALPVQLLDPAPPGEPSTWSGSIHAATDFALRYEQESGRAAFRASGSLRTAGLGATLAGLRIDRATTLWRGDLDLSGPVHGPPERASFQGLLDAADVHVRDPEGRLDVSVAGLHWEGAGGWRASLPAGAGGAGTGGWVRSLAAGGAVEVDSLELTHVRDDAAPTTVRLDGLRLNGRLDRGGKYRCDRLDARRIQVHAAPGGVEARVEVDHLELLELHGASDGAHAARFLSSAIEARTGNGTSALHWVADRLALDQVDFVSGDHASAATATIESLKVRGPGAALSAAGARIQGLRLHPEDGVAAGSASLGHLEQRRGERTLRIREARGESLAVAWSGTFEGVRVSAERLAGSRAEREIWNAQGLVAEPFRVRAGVVETDAATLGALVWRLRNGGLVESAGLSARAFALRPSGGGDTERLHAESLRYRAAPGGSWRVQAASLVEARWDAGGPASAVRAGADHVWHRDVQGVRWQLDALDLGRPSLDAGGGARSEGAAAERAALAWPSGGSFEAREIESGVARRLADGTASFASLRIASLGYRSLSGLAWRATPVEADRLTRAAGGPVEAHRVRARAWSLDGARGARWRAEEVEASRFAWRASGRLQADPLSVRRLRFARGEELAWSTRVVLADAFDWHLGHFPRARRASAAVLDGTHAGGSTWMLSDLQAEGMAEPATGPSRFRRFSAGPGHVESAAGAARFSWLALHAEDLGIENPERFAAALVAFDDAALRREGGLGASLDAVRVALRAFTRERRHLAAEQVVLDETRTSLGVGEGGEWTLPGWPGSGAGTGLGWTWRIGELGTGGHNRLTFFDRSIDPPYRAIVEPYRLSVSGLDTGEAERGARLDLRGAFGDLARLELSGKLRGVPRGGFDLHATARLRDLPLRTLSGYASRHLDLLIEAGSGDLDFDFELAGGHIRGLGELALRGLALHPATPAGGGDDESLADALARRADGQEELRLRVPVRGAIADPGFDFGEAAGQAIARSVRAIPEPAAEGD